MCQIDIRAGGYVDIVGSNSLLEQDHICAAFKAGILSEQRRIWRELQSALWKDDVTSGSLETIIFNKQEP